MKFSIAVTLILFCQNVVAEAGSKPCPEARLAIFTACMGAAMTPGTSTIAKHAKEFEKGGRAASAAQKELANELRSQVERQLISEVSSTAGPAGTTAISMGASKEDLAKAKLDTKRNVILATAISMLDGGLRLSVLASGCANRTDDFLKGLDTSAMRNAAMKEGVDAEQFFKLAGANLSTKKDSLKPLARYEFNRYRDLYNVPTEVVGKFGPQIVAKSCPK